MATHWAACKWCVKDVVTSFLSEGDTLNVVSTDCCQGKHDEATLEAANLIKKLT